MNDNIQSTLDIAKGISEYGITIIICAVFLVLASGLMIACFTWFKKLIDNLISENSKNLQRQDEKWSQLLSETKKQNELLTDLSEGQRSETMLRIRNLSNFAFDLSIEQVCRFIRTVREENHIADKEATREKIHKSVTVMHDERNNRFDSFTYRGKLLSSYTDTKWIDKVESVIAGEIYNEQGPNNGRAYTNVKLAYDDIRTEFYHKLNA